MPGKKVLGGWLFIPFCEKMAFVPVANVNLLALVPVRLRLSIGACAFSRANMSPLVSVRCAGAVGFGRV